ncbi:unnamed protein product [Nippostrongylus brasiliensis]|uniref:Uncharacterized protein n=1 Tax=Nippostrongylus brasiliensis TaxID=27835 RepID=A0A0N4YFM9_NIPBR|nr:unnamed protein product [Nippostrongylus brasiliensis]
MIFYVTDSLKKSVEVGNPRFLRSSQVVRILGVRVLRLFFCWSSKFVRRYPAEALRAHPYGPFHKLGDPFAAKNRERFAFRYRHSGCPPSQHKK